jgi:hypothetical protein
MKILRDLFLLAPFTDPLGAAQPVFEEPDEDSEPEYVMLGPDDPEPPEEDPDAGLPDDMRAMTKTQMFELLQKSKSEADLAQNLKAGIESLRDSVAAPAEPKVQQMQQQPGESFEDWKARINKRIFKEEDTVGVLSEVIERMVQPYVGQMMSNQMQLTRDQMKASTEHGSLFKRYENEIDREIAALPPRDQNNPQAVKWAYDKVLSRHQDDIVAEKAASLAEELLNKKLEELGIGKGSGAGTAAQPRFNESASQGAAIRTKGKIRYTQADVQRAMVAGIPVEEYVKRKYAGGIK